MTGHRGKPLVWLHGEVRSPPLTRAARLEAGWLLRRLQLGEMLGFPHSRPMPDVGRRCHELRIVDERVTWRIVYRVDDDAIVIAGVFAKRPAERRGRSWTPAGAGSASTTHFEQRGVGQHGRIQKAPARGRRLAKR